MSHHNSAQDHRQNSGQDETSERSTPSQAEGSREPGSSGAGTDSTPATPSQAEGSRETVESELKDE